jgi:hypothetical protein
MKRDDAPAGMTPVGWLISAALIVIAGIAYAATLLNVPLPAIAVGVVASLLAVFLLVTRRDRAPRVPTLREPSPADRSTGGAATAEPVLREPALDHPSPAERPQPQAAPLPENNQPRPGQTRSDHESNG